MASGNIVVGAHCRVSINGQAYGRTIRARFRSSTPNRSVNTIDSWVPIEFVPQQTEFTGNLSVYRLHADGGVQATGIAPTYPDLTLGKYFSILVLDRFSDTVLFRSDRCVLLEEDWDIPTRGFVTGSLSFRGISWSNEVQSKLTGAT